MKNRKRNKGVQIVPAPEEPQDQVTQARNQAEHAAKRLNNRQLESLEKLLDRFKITEWDLLLIGDGSGSNWGYPVGWGCVSIEKRTMKRHVWTGGMSLGTVNFAEMMAYLQPLTFYVSYLDERRKKYKEKRQAQQIHIITDSEYCKNQGRSSDLSPNRNGSLWRIFDDFQRQGLFLNWHWAPREDVGLNIFADALSKASRSLFKDYDPEEMAELLVGQPDRRTIYDINPSKDKASE